MALQEELIDVRGAKVQLWRGGKGDPLVYFHSFLGETGATPFLERLAEKFTVYAPMQPGFGRSEGLDRIDKIEDAVFHHVDLLNTLSLERAATVGLSFGGWLAAEVAVHHPSRVDRLVLIDALGLELTAAPVEDFFLVSSAELRRLLFHQPDCECAVTLLPNPPSAEATLALYQSRRAAARVGWNPYLCDPRLAQRLYRATMPTLVLWGESDHTASVEHAKTYHNGIVGSRLALIERAGHLSALESPENTAQQVIDFLTS